MLKSVNIESSYKTMATVQYLSPGSHTGGHMSNSHQQQPEFTVKEIFLLVVL